MIHYSKNLARIVSYLTFDGHLAKDFSCFYLSSKEKEVINKFKDDVYTKFRIDGIWEKGTGFGKSYKYSIFIGN